MKAVQFDNFFQGFLGKVSAKVSREKVSRLD